MKFQGSKCTTIICSSVSFLAWIFSISAKAVSYTHLYSFVEDVDAVGIIEAALRSANITENSLRTYWGENLYTFVNTSNVFAPLVEALQKTHSGTMDVRSIVVCAANAFESFLADFRCV